MRSDRKVPQAQPVPLVPPVRTALSVRSDPKALLAKAVRLAPPAQLVRREQTVRLAPKAPSAPRV